MLLALPPIKIADDTDTLCVRRPHRKGDAAFAFVSNHMRAQLFVNSFVLAFAEQVEIHFAERGREAGGVRSPTVREGLIRNSALANARASDLLCLFVAQCFPCQPRAIASGSVA